MSSGGFFDFRAKVTPKRGVAARQAPTAPAGLAVPSAVPAPLTVSQLTAWIDRVLKEELPRQVHVKGEISNYSIHGPSKHHYFTLKDAFACVNCVMWGDEAARLKFKPAGGMEVLATGRIAVYAQRGHHQLYVT